MLKSFTIWSLGCKVNQYESQQIRELLQQFGLDAVSPEKQPDLIVVNTCCVTATASAKSRQAIRRLQRQCPHATVVVCGCLPSGPTKEFSGLAKHLLFVQDREALAAELARLTGKAASTRFEESAAKHSFVTIKTDPNIKIKAEDNQYTPQLPLLTHFGKQTRAFLKVQDGCDAHCSYCIIPRVRPKLSSKPLDQAVAEAQALILSGHKEIVITGVFLGAYGQDTTRRLLWKPSERTHLGTLLARLAQVPNLPRIRLSSLEPADVTKDLLNVMAAHPCIMPHLHLSLQSGTDDVLKRMGRRYTTAEYRTVVNLTRKKLDRPALTTDIIVGFPGETETNFEQTLAFARAVGFAKIHVFAYSPRAETPAARLKNPVDNRVIQERSERLRQLDSELGAAYRRQFLGQQAEVLIEDAGDTPSGLSERYFKVSVANPLRQLTKNDLVDVQLTTLTEDGLEGSLTISESSSPPQTDIIAP
ncbi:tRNA (N(6)-L-threonylcarbamoyladenosine(37)-C(2))-methylthiotransferase MtaB [Planctomycetota bacterium]